MSSSSERLHTVYDYYRLLMNENNRIVYGFFLLVVPLVYLFLPLLLSLTPLDEMVVCDEAGLGGWVRGERVRK